MAKRSRGTTRPGQRRPITRAPQRPAARAAAPSDIRPATSLTEAEEARAAELEAQLLAQERAAQTGRDRERQRDRARSEGDGLARGRTRESGLLAARAAEEYTYVVRDVRRIARVAGVLLGVMAVLFVLIDILGLIKV